MTLGERDRYSILVRRAEQARRIEPDPKRVMFWIGYLRGLRRAYNGDGHGNPIEHEVWQRDAHDATDALHRAHGRGYLAGLALEAQEPPEMLD